MLKIQVNNKSLSNEKKVQHKKENANRQKFGDLNIHAVMNYIEKLEKRIEALESKSS